MPGLHHPVAGALGGDRQSIELPRQAEGEVADIDHFLNFTLALFEDLRVLQRHQFAKLVLVRPKDLAEQSDQLAPLGRRHAPPFQKGLSGRGDLGDDLIG